MTKRIAKKILRNSCNRSKLDNYTDNQFIEAYRIHNRERYKRRNDKMTPGWRFGRWDAAGSIAPSDIPFQEITMKYENDETYELIDECNYCGSKNVSIFFGNRAFCSTICRNKFNRLDNKDDLED
jgi:hypothetical protein